MKRRIHLDECLRKHLPVVNWLIAYSLKDALGDLLAGLTVGLTLIPQAIAYASLAGLGPQFGLYSSFAGSFVYIIFGNIKEVNIGPTAIISLLTFSYARGIPELTILLCFLSGCLTILLGILRLSFLVNFISTPVVGGFTSAASLIIACGQIKNLLGIKFEGEQFFDVWTKIIYHAPETKIPDLILSCCCIVVLLTLRKLKDVRVTNKFLSGTIWILSTGRNAIIVIVTTVISYFLADTFVITGHIETGLPEVKPPPVSYVENSQTKNFAVMFSELGTGILVIPTISIIGNVAIAKAFSRGKSLDATQELLALGLSNIVGSFFQSVPVSGSFSRSAVNNASGVRTPFGGFYTGILVILSLSFLTPYFYHIPKATLSSVIICAVIFMVEINLIKSIWRCNKRDLFPALGTFLACLYLGVELGILVGIAIDFMILAYFNAKPTVKIENKQGLSQKYLLIKLSSGLMYPAVEHIRTEITTHMTRMETDSEAQIKYAVLDCSGIDRIDFTAVQTIHCLITDLSTKNYETILMKVDPIILNTVQSMSSVTTINSESEFSNDDTFQSKRSVEMSTSL